LMLTLTLQLNVGTGALLSTLRPSCRAPQHALSRYSQFRNLRS
jgi:hypothetical protein